LWKIAVMGVKKYRGGKISTILPGTMLGKIIQKNNLDYKREFCPIKVHFSMKMNDLLEFFLKNPSYN